MSASQKLTKKQKKGIAFRERKKGKAEDATVDNDVPVAEDQDLAGVQVRDVDGEEKVGAGEGIHGKSKGKAKERTKDNEVAEAQQAKKRKWEAVVEGTEKPQRKRKKESSGEDKEPEVKKEKQRFILFVGNLKYATSIDAIKEHFAICDPPPKIRLLTPKPSAQKTTTSKSKGCAFLEFSHRNALQQALKLHQSELDGRKINVELTAGGGGKSETRLGKVRERNKQLHGQRTKRTEKQGDQVQPQQPQRFSGTSGLEQTTAGKRTWTVGETVEDQPHRGGQRHTKPKMKTKSWGTGVNSIPVG